MKKHTYIQPEIGINMIGSDAFVMLQPSNSNKEPEFAPKRAATPTNPVMPLDSVSVF